MKICTLSSGSSGNCLLVETQYSKILVDAGISYRKIKNYLQSIDIDIDQIDAVIVSHEHSDHTLAIPYFKKPVYVSSSISSLWEDAVLMLEVFDSGTPFVINDIKVTPFPVPHDAVDPVGFTLEAEGGKIGILTDIGVSTRLVSERLKGLNLIVMEFNHDENMLLNSSYPWHLKQRIKSRLGHLSNIQASNLLKTIIHENLDTVVLAHLSKVNNDPNTAYEYAARALNEVGMDSVNISVAPRNNMGEVIQI